MDHDGLLQLDADRLRSCATCGLVQQLPPLQPRQRACCARCHTSLMRGSVIERGHRRVASLALAALILYPFAVTLPMVRLEQFGHAYETSILGGIGSLFRNQQWFVGIIVLACSIVFPMLKLLGLFVLAAGGLGMQHHHRAWTYRIVDWTGRWGMLDVLLVAILVAAVKIGELVEITAGPAAIAFATVVLLSLLSAACFDPHALWEGQRRDRNSVDHNAEPRHAQRAVSAAASTFTPATTSTSTSSSSSSPT